MANLVHNERVKLRATLFNTAAASCIALGVLAPIVAAFYGLGTRPPLFWLLIGAIIGLPPLARSTPPLCGRCGGCGMTDPYTIARRAAGARRPRLGLRIAGRTGGAPLEPRGRVTWNDLLIAISWR
jgi:hypothetical protein